MEFGPQNVQSEVWSGFCREDPWTNLLYINNFNIKDATTDVKIVFENVLYLTKVSFPFQCMGVTWYLANDMQFFLMTPPLIFLIWKWKKIGLMFSGIFNVPLKHVKLS